MVKRKTRLTRDSESGRREEEKQPGEGERGGGHSHGNPALFLSMLHPSVVVLFSHGPRPRRAGPPTDVNDVLLTAASCSTVVVVRAVNEPRVVGRVCEKDGRQSREAARNTAAAGTPLLEKRKDDNWGDSFFHPFAFGDLSVNVLDEVKLNQKENFFGAQMSRTKSKMSFPG